MACFLSFVYIFSTWFSLYIVRILIQISNSQLIDCITVFPSRNSPFESCSIFSQHYFVVLFKLIIGCMQRNHSFRLGFLVEHYRRQMNFDIFSSFIVFHKNFSHYFKSLKHCRLYNFQQSNLQFQNLSISI